MGKKLSMGSWAYIFNQKEPTLDFHDVLHKLHHLGYEGVELGSFGTHPTPLSHPTKADRDKLGIVLITHYQRLLNELQPDHVHILIDGRIVASGGMELAEKLEADGYESFRTGSEHRG